jgi:hypothetical protein
MLRSNSLKINHIIYLIIIFQMRSISCEYINDLIKKWINKLNFWVYVYINLYLLDIQMKQITSI